MKSLIWTAVSLLALTSMASAQAAVEGALTHGLSGTASAGAGKALGQIGNQLAGRLGQQTSNAVRPAAVRPGTQKVVKVPQAAAPKTAASGGGSMIASIQGGEPQQTKACAAESADKTAQDVQRQTDCAKTTASTVEQAAHPSEITLPAPKQ